MIRPEADCLWPFWLLRKDFGQDSIRLAAVQASGHSIRTIKWTLAKPHCVYQQIDCLRFAL